MKTAQPKLFRLSKGRAVWLLVAVVGVCVYLRESWNEPEYQGRPLSFWVSELHLTIMLHDSNGMVTFKDSSALGICGLSFSPEEYRDKPRVPEEAIAAFGTNALPFLLGEVQATDSRFARFVERMGDRYAWEPPRALLPNATVRQAQALTAFRILGTNAAVVLAEVRRMTNSDKAAVQYAAKLILEGIDDEKGTWSLMW